MANKRRHKAEIRRLSRIAGEAIERERAQRARLHKRGRRLVRSGRTVALTSMAGLLALVVARKRHDRDDRDANGKRRRDAVKRAGDRKDKRILELARLALTTSRLWESAAARR